MSAHCETQLSDSPRDICILRLSALGDVCNLVPSVRALQAGLPNAQITWVIGKAEYSLLAGLEGVKFYIYDKKTGLAGMRQLRQQLLTDRQNRPFDVLLHMQAALRASVLSRFIPARRRIGFDRDRAKDWQGWFVNEQIAANPKRRVCHSFLDFPHHLGVTLLSPNWGIPIPLGAKQEAERLLCGRTQFILISPCANSRTRNWRNWENYPGFAEIIAHAKAKYQLDAVLVGGGSVQEREAAEAIMKNAGDSALNLTGQTDLKTLLALIERCVYVIAPDSGPIHMAAALGKPALGLYATTNPERGGPWDIRYVVNAYPRAVQQYLKTQPEALKWGQRVRHPEAMSVIQVEDIREKMAAIAQDTGLKTTDEN